MEPSAAKGNSSEKWEKLLTELDEKLQLGLLDRLRRVTSYHFEDQTLFIVAGSSQDLEYLQKDSVKQQLAIFASGSGVTSITLQKKPT
jgi:hypothetical protein